MIEEMCIEDKSEVILEPGGVSRLDFVFQPTNRTLSKTIMESKVEDCNDTINLAQSRWPAAAGVLVAAVISLVGFFFPDQLLQMHRS